MFAYIPQDKIITYFTKMILFKNKADILDFRNYTIDIKSQNWKIYSANYQNKHFVSKKLLKK